MPLRETGKESDIADCSSSIVVNQKPIDGQHATCIQPVWRQSDLDLQDASPVTLTVIYRGTPQHQANTVGDRTLKDKRGYIL